MRKKTTKSIGENNAMVSFTATKSEAEKMNEIAKKFGVSRSQWLRDAIEYSLANETGKRKQVRPLESSLDAALDLLKKSVREESLPKPPIDQRSPKAGDGPNRK